MYVLKKVYIALLSSFLLGFFLLIYTVVRSWFVPYNSLLGSIWEFALNSQFYSIPAYVLVGAPCSMLIDALTYRIKFRPPLLQYSVRVILYAFAGVLAIVLFKHFSQTGTVVYFGKPAPVADALRVVISGGLPALLFYHTSLLLR